MRQASPPSHVPASVAVALCGIMWGVFWMPMHWIGAQGVGGAWVSVIFNAVALLTPLPWLLRRSRWDELPRQAINGLILGSAFSLYMVSLVTTDVIHAILLFYLTPVWSTIGGRLWLGQPLTLPRLAALVFGLAGMVAILGAAGGIPLPSSGGDWVALASGMLWAAGTLRSYARPAAGIALPVFTFCAGGLASAVVILVIASALALPMAATGNMAATMPWIITLALITFVPPNFLVLWAAQRIDPGRVGILLMGEVVVGSISAALFSNQAYGRGELAGTALIVAAGLIEVLGRSRVELSPHS